MRNAVRRIRLDRRLTQHELARQAGMSRQTLSNIETGRAEPSTALALALASALQCTVEGLFWLEPGALRVSVAHPLSAPAIPCRRAPPPQRVALGNVDGRWVAHPLSAGNVVSLATAADALLSRRSWKRSTVRPLRPLDDLRRTILAVGCDPALGLLAARLASDHPGDRLVWVPAPSEGALRSLAQGEAHLAGAHLLDEDSGEFNVPFVRKLLPRRNALVVNLARWRAGLVVARGNPKGIRGGADLGRPGIRIVNRERGAGARHLLDRILSAARVVGTQVRGYGQVLGGHAAVAQAVAMGMADAGIATEGAALSCGLSFVALAEERSDLVVPLSLAAQARGGHILDVLASRAFRLDLGGIAAYGTAESGRVLAEVRA